MASTASSSLPASTTYTTYPGPPSVSLTPATPPTPYSPTMLGPPITSTSPSKSSEQSPPPQMVEHEEMREKAQPTDSKTALVADSPPPPQQDLPSQEPQANSGSFQNLARRSSGRSASSSAVSSTPVSSPPVWSLPVSSLPSSSLPSSSPPVSSLPVSSLPVSSPPVSSPRVSSPPAEALREIEKMPATQPTKPINTSSQNSMMARPAPPTVMPASTSTQKASQKKRRKRTGIAGFFAALGCLSSREIEDDTPSGGNAMAQKPGSGTTQRMATSPDTAGAGPSTTVNTLPTIPESDHLETTETSGMTGTTLAGGEGDKDRSGAADGMAPGDEVVIAPVEPVTLPDDETAGVTSSAVQAPGSGSALSSTPLRSHSINRGSAPAAEAGGDNERTETSGGYSNISESDAVDQSSGQVAEDHGEDYPMEEEYEDEEDRLIAQGGMGIPLDENGHPTPLLPVLDRVHVGRKCLVLDLDETLLHSSFKMLPTADYIVPVEIESQTHNVYVIKRPGVDSFLKEMGKIYEVVVFTASLSKYADPVLDMLDVHRVVRHRLFRESCYNHKGNYVKDLSQLGREMETCIIIDNSPASYIFHPNNAVPVSTWFNDPHDTELTDLCPFLTDLATVDDVRGVLDGSI